MPDPCFWCGKNRCRLTHVKPIKTYRKKLHQKAEETLKRDGYIKPPGLTQYETILWDNALRERKHPKEAVMSIERQVKGFLSKKDAKRLSSKLGAFLAKRNKPKGSYWPRRKKNPS